MKGDTLASYVIIIFALALSCGSEAQSRQVLQPTENCTDHGATAIVTFADPDLQEVVRAALKVSEQEDLTCDLVSQLTQLSTGSDSERVVYGGTLRP